MATNKLCNIEIEDGPTITLSGPGDDETQRFLVSVLNLLKEKAFHSGYFAHPQKVCRCSQTQSVKKIGSGGAPLDVCNDEEVIVISLSKLSAKSISLREESYEN